MANKTLTRALNEASAVADVLATKYHDTGASPVAANIIRMGLGPILRGIVIANYDEVPTGEVEDAIINIFTVALVDLLKRQHKANATPEEVSKTVQQTINLVAETLTEQIYAIWGPKVIIPQTDGKPN